jgi:hypothetical protein
MRSTLTRKTVPSHLLELTCYSDDPTLASPHTLVAMIKGMPKIHQALQQAFEPTYKWGPERMSGDWVLAYLAFVISRFPDIEPWYQRVREDSSFWRACGFGSPPSYRLAHLRFTEMEVGEAAFEEAAAQLIQMARRKDQRVSAWLHIDACEAETHAAPQHDCTAFDSCPTALKGRRNPRLMRVGTATAKATRQAIAASPSDDIEKPISVEGLRTIPVGESVVDHDRGGRHFTSGGHWWFTRDKEAGLRAYSRGDKVLKAWLGFLQIEVVDHFTHAPLTSRLIPADQQEYSAYEGVFERTVTNLGGHLPLLIAGDAEYSLSRVFQFNSDHGVGSVFPFRQKGGNGPKKREPTALFDEHGIPKCRHCGGETQFVRFAVVKKKSRSKGGAEEGQGRLWFRCRMGSPACGGEQTILCSSSPCDLLPLWRTEEAYAAMRVSHQSYEHKHRDLRIQYLVAPDCLALRPKRPGMAWQQLRSSAAVFIEWLRVLQRAGWGTAKAKVGAPTQTKGGDMVERLLRLRAEGRAAAARAPDGPAPPVPLIAPAA